MINSLFVLTSIVEADKLVIVASCSTLLISPVALPWLLLDDVGYVLFLVGDVEGVPSPS